MKKSLLLIFVLGIFVGLSLMSFSDAANFCNCPGGGKAGLDCRISENCAIFLDLPEESFSFNNLTIENNTYIQVIRYPSSFDYTLCQTNVGGGCWNPGCSNSRGGGYYRGVYGGGNGGCTNYFGGPRRCYTSEYFSLGGYVGGKINISAKNIVLDGTIDISGSNGKDTTSNRGAGCGGEGGNGGGEITIDTNILKGNGNIIAHGGKGGSGSNGADATCKTADCYKATGGSVAGGGGGGGQGGLIRIITLFEINSYFNNSQNSDAYDIGGGSKGSCGLGGFDKQCSCAFWVCWDNCGFSATGSRNSQCTDSATGGGYGQVIINTPAFTDASWRNVSNINQRINTINLTQNITLYLEGILIAGRPFNITIYNIDNQQIWSKETFSNTNSYNITLNTTELGGGSVYFIVKLVDAPEIQKTSYPLLIIAPNLTSAFFMNRANEKINTTTRNSTVLLAVDGQNLGGIPVLFEVWMVGNPLKALGCNTLLDDNVKNLTTTGQMSNRTFVEWKVSDSKVGDCEGKYYFKAYAIDKNISSKDLAYGELDVSGTGNQAPVARISSPASDRYYNLSTNITFDASASYDADDPIVAYEWDFGDGTNYSVCDNALANTQQIFDQGCTVPADQVTDSVFTKTAQSFKVSKTSYYSMFSAALKKGTGDGTVIISIETAYAPCQPSGTLVDPAAQKTITLSNSNYATQKIIFDNPIFLEKDKLYFMVFNLGANNRLKRTPYGPDKDTCYPNGTMSVFTGGGWGCGEGGPRDAEFAVYSTGCVALSSTPSNATNSYTMCSGNCTVPVTLKVTDARGASGNVTMQLHLDNTSSNEPPLVAINSVNTSGVKSLNANGTILSPPIVINATIVDDVSGDVSSKITINGKTVFTNTSAFTALVPRTIVASIADVTALGSYFHSGNYNLTWNVTDNVTGNKQSSAVTTAINIPGCSAGSGTLIGACVQGSPPDYCNGISAGKDSILPNPFVCGCKSKEYLVEDSEGNLKCAAGLGDDCHALSDSNCNKNPGCYWNATCSSCDIETLSSCSEYTNSSTCGLDPCNINLNGNPKCGDIVGGFLISDCKCKWNGSLCNFVYNRTNTSTGEKILGECIGNFSKTTTSSGALNVTTCIICPGQPDSCKWKIYQFLGALPIPFFTFWNIVIAIFAIAAFYWFMNHVTQKKKAVKKKRKKK